MKAVVLFGAVFQDSFIISAPFQIKKIVLTDAFFSQYFGHGMDVQRNPSFMIAAEARLLLLFAAARERES